MPAKPPPVDLARARRALEGLDHLAREHPELTDENPYPANLNGWLDTLESEMNDKQVAFRLPTELVDRVDAYAERLRERNPGLRVTRADAVRYLLTLALDREEQDGATDNR